jgi:uncharacterized protein
MLRYADSSCLLRLLFSEKGTRLPLSGATILSSVIARVEVHRAIERARLTGVTNDHQTALLLRGAAELLGKLHLLPVDDEVILQASAAFTVNVRALDALHVATAETLRSSGQPLEFWTHDERQALAAGARALATFG